MSLHLYNIDGCPFAQRTKMTLIEKALPYEETYIDQRNKPDWFLKMNPTGKIPVIVHDGQLVRESAVVLEYLEEVFQSPAMLPPDPYPRSQVRLWLQFINTEYVPVFYRIILNGDPDQRGALQEAMRAQLRQLALGISQMSGEGPYFAGAEFGMLDASIAPFIERHVAVEDLGGCPIPDEPEYDPIRTWWKAIEARPSFQQTRRDDAFWIKLYRDYAAGTWGRTYFQANPGGD